MTNLLQQRLNELHTDNAIDYPTYSELFDMAADVVSIATAELALIALKRQLAQCESELSIWKMCHSGSDDVEAQEQVSELDSYCKRLRPAVAEMTGVVDLAVDRDIAAHQASSVTEQ